MNTLTLRRIPAPVEQRLRRISRESRKSLNRTAVDLLEKAVGLGPKQCKPRKFRDVRSVFQTWSPHDAAEFKRNTKAFNVIDEEAWK